MRAGQMKRGSLFLGVLMPLALGGCSQEEQAELSQWMEATRQQTRAQVPEVAAPRAFSPFAYAVRDLPSPFDLVKLTGAEKLLQPEKSQGPVPDLERAREQLEYYPLDALTMVGSIQKRGSSYALVSAAGAVHAVRAGQYMGQNLGKVTRVGSSQVVIQESVQDAAGDWVTREARLELQEAGK